MNRRLHKIQDTPYETISTVMKEIPGAGTLDREKLLPQVRERSVELHVFPKPFHCLAPAEMEHLLCFCQSSLRRED